VVEKVRHQIDREEMRGVVWRRFYRRGGVAIRGAPSDEGGDREKLRKTFRESEKLITAEI